uniref:Uncharacterized protein n=1 Tax=Eutreptiella gymnastica TaxID=73025 RepID=A0A7S1JER5_9EUGL
MYQDILSPLLLQYLQNRTTSRNLLATTTQLWLARHEGSQRFRQLNTYRHTLGLGPLTLALLCEEDLIISEACSKPSSVATLVFAVGSGCLLLTFFVILFGFCVRRYCCSNMPKLERVQKMPPSGNRQRSSKYAAESGSDDSPPKQSPDQAAKRRREKLAGLRLVKPSSLDESGSDSCTSSPSLHSRRQMLPKQNSPKFPHNHPMTPLRPCLKPLTPLQPLQEPLTPLTPISPSTPSCNSMPTSPKGKVSFSTSKEEIPPTDFSQFTWRRSYSGRGSS